MSDDQPLVALTPNGRTMGHIPGEYPATAQPIRPLIGALRAGSLQPVDHSHYVDHIRNQNPLSSCVGAARARVLHCLAQRQAFGGPNPSAVPYPSELGIYTLARLLAGGPLRDAGSSPACADEALSVDVGVPLERDWPFDPSKVNEPLPAEVLARAFPYKMKEYRVVDSYDSQRVDDVCQVLSQIGPMTCAIPVGPEYDGCVDDTLVRPASKEFGGHDIALMGWDYVPGRMSRRRFLNAGSWGTGFGRLGWAWLDEDVIADPRCDSLVVPQVVLNWIAPKSKE